MMRTTLAACWASIMVLACYGASNEDEEDSGGGTSNAGSPSKGGSAGKGGSNSGGSSTAGSSVGGSAGAAAASCPAAPPTPGSACALPGEFFALAHCSWGDDPRPRCRTQALCQQEQWQVTEAGPECEAEPLPATCPETPAEQGSVCSDPTEQCWYDDSTRCSCSECEGGSAYPICQTIDPPEWACVKPAEGCPNPPPQAGEPCDQPPELQCGHDCELTITCQNGVWQYGGNMCPICAAPDTPIETPAGPRPIAALRLGDLVYSIDHGAIAAVPIARAGSTPVYHHRVVRLVLESGAVLEMSPGHPTADGRTFTDLLRGGALDERHAVVEAELVPYRHERTYDILPASSSKTYFAAGALVGSTL